MLYTSLEQVSAESRVPIEVVPEKVGVSSLYRVIVIHFLVAAAGVFSDMGLCCNLCKGAGAAGN